MLPVDADASEFFIFADASAQGSRQYPMQGAAAIAPDGRDAFRISASPGGYST
jgi:hypothetical protein